MEAQAPEGRAPEEREQAQNEALNQLEHTKANARPGKWWVFEGRSSIDCCLIAVNCVLFVEGKRTESLSPATQWFKQWSQLWRNVEAAQDFAAGTVRGDPGGGE